MDIFFSIGPLLIGWILDRIFGDPINLPHPIIFFGKLIAKGEKLLNKGNHRIIKGTSFTIILILGTFFITYYLLTAVDKLIGNWGVTIISGILIFYCLAGTTLINEVKKVFQALDDSLEAGRKQVSRIVGRDTKTLSEQEVKTAALETLAENLSDGVIAPLFWLFILGLPGMIAYKMINTLDSMIGYRNQRYLLFGKTAAHIDDIANYIPARLTAILMIIASGHLSLFKFVKKYGNQHASPNSGYPEAALAGILNCRFGGAHNYFGEMVWKPYIGRNNKILTNADLKKAIHINLVVETIMIIIGIIITIIMQMA